jgi:hypothetical protein
MALHEQTENLLRACVEADSGPLTVWLLRAVVNRMTEFEESEDVRADVKQFLDFGGFEGRELAETAREVQRGWVHFEGEGSVLQVLA